MPDLVLVLLGSAAAFAVTAIVARRRRAGADQRKAAKPSRRGISPRDDATIAQIAETIGSELADLATGVEGHAQLLCEVIGQPAEVAGQAQRLWSAVRKLRLFSEKVLCSASGTTPDRTATDARALLAGLHQELEEYSGAGLRITCEAGEELPPAFADRESLRKSLLFVVDALLELETNAGLVVLQASARGAGEARGGVEIEIRAESEDVPQSPIGREKAFALAYAAARNLLAAMGASLWLEHCPGLCSTARIRLPAAPPDVAPAAGPATAEQQHPYGGILIVEDDASVRTVVAREMEKTGRRIFSCPDEAAARSLLLATPERFELLILDGASRRQSAALLASEAVARSPQLKILWLSAGPQAPSDAPLGSDARRIRLPKPFGIIELREAVTGLLGSLGPSPTRA